MLNDVIPDMSVEPRGSPALDPRPRDDAPRRRPADAGDDRGPALPRTGSVFARHLHARAPLPRSLRAALDVLAGGPRRAVDRNDLVGHDRDPKHLHVVERGMACRRQVLDNGAQQITSLILPGEICDPLALFLPLGMGPVHALTNVSIVEVPVDEVRALAASFRELETALQWQARVANDIQHMWIGNLGRRPALARMAHFFCEMAVRLDTVGLVSKDAFDFRLTQIDIADILGMSIIHTNRVLQDLKVMDLLRIHGKTATIPSFRKLQGVAMFNPDYLHVTNL